MTVKISGQNVGELYEEAHHKMKIYGSLQNSRNGRVLRIPGPVELELINPWQRVLLDEDRNANPFFHVMETVWMLAGEDHVGFLAKFNSTYVNYAEADGSVHGAYGKRWRDHFTPKEIGPRYRMDQIQLAVAMLKNDPETRRVVVSMWDATVDLNAQKKDLPCNTHIYFDGNDGKLDMTVCNRSNDLLWGMLGANVVHMTYLQELIAFGAGMEIGTYRVLSNNVHVYLDRPDVQKFLEGVAPARPYVYESYPLLREGEKVEDLLADCENMIKGVMKFKTQWMNHVALPMHDVWIARNVNGLDHIDQIKAEDWRVACQERLKRKTSSVI